MTNWDHRCATSVIGFISDKLYFFAGLIGFTMGVVAFLVDWGIEVWPEFVFYCLFLLFQHEFNFGTIALDRD